MEVFLIGLRGHRVQLLVKEAKRAKPGHAQIQSLIMVALTALGAKKELTNAIHCIVQVLLDHFCNAQKIVTY